MALNDAMWTFKGEVINGNQIGRKMGIPTVNIAVDENNELPEFGVYAAKLVYIDCSGDEKSYKGVANIGIKPTIENEKGTNPVGVEINLFEFEGDLYTQNVQVDFYKFIRSEKKFNSIDELKNQIEQDIVSAKEVFGMI